MSRATLVLLLAGITLAGAVEVRAAGIETDPATPTEGEPVTIRITGELGGTLEPTPVRARYRPGSEVERLEEIGSTGPDGLLTWTPTGAGVVALEAGPPDALLYTRNLSVHFPGLPISGLFILIGAGIVLYGGVIRGFRSLNTPPPQLPPDT